LKIGAVTLPFEDVPFEKAAGLISGFGYEMVELGAWKGSRHLNIDRLPQEKAGLEKSLTRYGLEISALNNSSEAMLILGPYDESTDYIHKGKPEEKAKYGMSRIKSTAEAARILNVPTVVGMVGTPGWRWYPYPFGNEQLFEESWSVFARRMGEAIDHFAKYGINFACEVHPGTQVYNLETATRAIKELNGKREFGINFDPSHLAWQMIDVVVYVKTLGDRIYHAHAKDVELEKDVLPSTGIMPYGSLSRPNRGMRFRTPGWGDINWRRLLTALAEVKYDYVLSYEHEDPVIAREDGMVKCLDFLRPLLIGKKRQ
jgi:sugar phosphate isomerase/epimerase